MHWDCVSRCDWSNCTGAHRQPWGRMTARVALPLLLLGVAGTSQEYREPMYRDCVSQVDWSNCTGARRQQWKERQPFYMSLTGECG
ncbi:hypothetical protein NDU88_007779 [Pleurodeles waltl]|uniref:Uncharacterized protein n=1 Tax=Pleurodeles waltl TaxID=8319 RepID=A0AAV7RW27_PLEWA|nr:hypothetical protein NDU88_007779 [Pleurodeles waltl]